MSIESEINRINTNVQNTLAAIEEMGGEVPEDGNSDDMAGGVRTIPVGAKIDDTTPSASTTYSSEKIEAELSKQKEANDAQDEEIAKKLNASELPTAINTALAQAKESGQFDGAPGAPGKDYILTEADKEEIAEMAAEKVEVPEGGGTGGGGETVKYELLANLQGDGESLSVSQDVDIVKRGLYAMLFEVKGADAVNTGDTIYAKFGGVGVWGAGFRSAGFVTTNNQYDTKGYVMLFMTNGQGKACVVSQGGSANMSPDMKETDIQNKVSLYSQGSKSVYTGASMKLWRVV